MRMRTCSSGGAVSLFVLFSQCRVSARDVALLRGGMHADRPGDLRVLRVGVEDHLPGAAPRWPCRPSRRTRRNGRRSGSSRSSRCTSPPARPPAPGTSLPSLWILCTRPMRHGVRDALRGACSSPMRPGSRCCSAARTAQARERQRMRRPRRSGRRSRPGGRGLFLRCQACRDEVGEQRAGGEGLGLELGVELHPDPPGMVRPLHGFHERCVRGEAAHDQPRLLQGLAVLVGHLVAVAVALGDHLGAVGRVDAACPASGGCRSFPGAWSRRTP